MARTPDKPGTYRVRQKGGEWIVSGRRNSGDRIRLSASSPGEAQRIADGIFGPKPSIGPIPGGDVLPGQGSGVVAAVDDWGIPIRVSPELAASVASSFNLPANSGTMVGSVVPGATDPKEDAEKKARRAKHAKSLMEMAGMGYAAGTVALSRRMVVSAGKEPVNPNPKQVNDLADCTKETLIEWFGDREIKPWQMMFLLTIGIPAAMWLQSPKVKPEDKRNLKSVP